MNCFKDLPPGASQQLRDWAHESEELLELADRVDRLQILKKQLHLSHRTGAAQQC